jgi:hypothetical protein
VRCSQISYVRVRFSQERFQPMKIGKNNTNLGMCIQNVSYAGADSFTIRTEPNFSRLSRMLLNRESLLLSKRQDINALLSRFVKDVGGNARANPDARFVR